MSYAVTTRSVYYAPSLHDALPICAEGSRAGSGRQVQGSRRGAHARAPHQAVPVREQEEVMPLPYEGLDDNEELSPLRSEEHTSELQSRLHLVCRLLLETKIITTGV